MTYENRYSQLYAFGTLSQAAAISDTTLNSAEFANLISPLSTTAYEPIVLQDPSTKLCEVVWATSHASSATSLTVIRAREDTIARAWPAGTLWTQAATTRDGVLLVWSRSLLPTDPHVGMKCLINDESIVVEWRLGAGWVTTSAQLAGRIAASASSLGVTSGTTELNLPKLAITGARTRNTNVYMLSLTMSATMSAANDSFTVRVRKDTALSGTVLATWSWITQVASYTHSKTFTWPWKATADNASTNFYISIQRAAGTGTMDVDGTRSAFDVADRGSDSSVWAVVP